MINSEAVKELDLKALGDIRKTVPCIKMPDYVMGIEGTDTSELRTQLNKILFKMCELQGIHFVTYQHHIISPLTNSFVLLRFQLFYNEDGSPVTDTDNVKSKSLMTVLYHEPDEEALSFDVKPFVDTVDDVVKKFNSSSTVF